MNLEERVLVRAPTARDGGLTSDLLRHSGLETVLCDSLDGMALELERGAGAVLLTEDVEGSDSLQRLLGAIARQPRWSEVPVLVLAHPTRGQRSLRRLASVPGLTLLERPVHSRTLVSALQSALRARRRQYQLKAQLEAMHDLQARLAEELSGMHRLHLAGARLLQHGILDDLLREVLHAALDLTGATLGAIELVDDAGGRPRIAVQAGFAGAQSATPARPAAPANPAPAAAPRLVLGAGGGCDSQIVARPVEVDARGGTGAAAAAGTAEVAASRDAPAGIAATPVMNGHAPHGDAGLELHASTLSVPSIGPGVLAARTTIRGSLQDRSKPDNLPFPQQALEDLRAGGIRMLQCAPLLGTAGRPLGVLSVYWRVAARDSETRRLLFDLLARQAADLIERDQAEQERLAADRRKDEFLATLAHELRNPLAPIRQAARVARAPAATAEQLRWSTEIIERQVSHMALLLDDLLDVSRITRGTLALRRERVALGEVIDAAVETSRPLIDARAHVLRVELPAEPVWLDADPVRLAQVLANLLNNAAKYTDRGGHVELWTSRGDDGIAIHVRDDGIGLDAASLTRVFEMFSQVTSSIERSEGGLGIGLALVRGLVAMHGGRVEARSEGPGRGSEFIVRLPLPPAAPVVAEPAPAADVDAVPGRRRIVVADDNVDAADSLALLLRLDGHQVEVVHDGEQAVEAVERLRPDVALLDIGMPKLNGYEAARRIRAGGADGPLLLVAVTGWGQREDRQLASRAGFDHHLTKPVDFERLAALVAKVPPPRGGGISPPSTTLSAAS